MIIVGKKTPLNDKGIRVMTPEEWGKLQGFVNYAFIDEEGVDRFSFPDTIPNVQRYKQLGNSVTIPAVKVMAEFMVRCLTILTPTESDNIIALATQKEYISISFALHTGSVCFDIISVIAASLGVFAYNINTNDDILAALNVGDMVMFKNERHRWKGTTIIKGEVYIALEQDGKGKNGKSICYIPYERNKHTVKPYYGTSSKTDGRGVRRRKTNREDFLSYVYDTPISDVPAEIDTAVVVVADRAEFSDICRNLHIVYGSGKQIGLLDLIPASYYTSNGSAFQFGTNPTKAEAVLKVTGKIETARDLVLDKTGKKVVGLLISGIASLVNNGTELADLLRRKSLHFVHITSPMRMELCDNILNLYDDSSVFACTKEFLSQSVIREISYNTLTKEGCGCYPRTVQRGASSVYFPIVYSSLVIPPYADQLNAKIESSKAFEDCVTIINDEDDEDDKLAIIKKRFSKWAEKISLEIGASISDVEKILTRKWLEHTSGEIDVTSVQYRIEEYLALSGEAESPTQSLGDFLRESIDIKEYGIPHVKSVSLIEKVRVVNALIGFSRLSPIMNKEDKGFVSIKEPKTRWYPAYEVRGEGIFIEFNQEEIDSWITSHPSINERVQRIAENYRKSFIGQNHPRTITPKFIMLHTLSHLLISQLSFECGYSIASLSERLYCSEAADGKNMAGIFIYTASGDSEGTLGGLVRQGRPDSLPQIFKKAIRNAKVCSNDPVCIMSRGQGRDSLNLAACYACGLLPETCCEERNGFLDRGVIVGTYDEPKIGFWKEFL